MAVSAAHSRPRRSAHTDNFPRGVRLFFWTLALTVVALVTLAAVREWRYTSAVMPQPLVWVGMVATADLLPVSLWGSVTLSLSLPVSLAAGMLFSPPQAALIAILGSIDPREFRGEVGLGRALYNRSQVALAVLGSSLVFHSLGVGITDWPRVLLPTVAMLGADFVVNACLVVVPTSRISDVPPMTILRNMFGVAPVQYVLGYLSLAVFALLLALVATAAGLWAAVAFLAPLALARQMFVEAQRVNQATRRLEEKNQALVDVIHQVAEERRDERMVLAGELHDEVLPPLFKVHLFGQVLRQDLSSGRLLDLDDDLPELLSATELAQAAVRSLVHDLRQSSLGPGGLNSTLRLLASQLETAGSAHFQLELDDVGGSKLAQLLLYQVAREAMNNAARHSRATTISVRIWREAGLLRIVVEDDGIGFDPRLVDKNQHFGLQLVGERLEAVRGRFVIDSRLGGGTTVVATLPPEA